jgi:hypothetical protein
MNISGAFTGDASLKHTADHAGKWFSDIRKRFPHAEGNFKLLTL